MLRTIWSAALLLFALGAFTSSQAVAQEKDLDVELVMEELTEALELSDEQAQEVGGHLQAFGAAMDEATHTVVDSGTLGAS